MSDDDLIRRGDARRIAMACSEGGEMAERAGDTIDALPAMQKTLQTELSEARAALASLKGGDHE